MKHRSTTGLTAMFAATALAACNAPPEEAALPAAPDDVLARIDLSNPSEFARRDAVTTLDLDVLGLAADGPYRVESDAAEVPSQLSDTDADGDVDAIVFAADFGPAERTTVEIVAGEPSVPPKRTQAEVSIKEGGVWDGKVYKGGEFVNVDAVRPPPQYTDHSEYIRYEGPGIESDKVGYRVYLDWRNGFDVFGKTTDAMVLQDVGLDGYDSYHEPADWGLDILKVGDAVGIGGYGFWDGDKVIRVAETSGRATRVVESGPLTSTLEIIYDNWQVPGYTTDLKALLSMQAGSRLVHTRLAVSPDLPNLAVGLVRHPDAEFIEGTVDISGHAWTYVATWGPQALADGDLGMVLLFRRSDRAEQTEDEHNYVSVLSPGNGQVEYYFGAAWSQEPGGITSREAFVEWLGQEAEKLAMPLRSRIETALAEAQTANAIDPATALDSYLTGDGEILTYDASLYNIDRVNSGKMLSSHND
jgi:unsaturated rhamnogalacturonyl hydrolase